MVVNASNSSIGEDRPHTRQCKINGPGIVVILRKRWILDVQTWGQKPVRLVMWPTMDMRKQVRYLFSIVFEDECGSLFHEP